MLLNVIASAIVNLVLFAGIPFVFYFVYHKLRHKRGIGEVVERAGLKPGEMKYLGYSALAAVAVILVLVIFPLSLEASVAEGSAFRSFNGLGLTVSAVVMALIYGVVKTGFAEEFLFRGLIAGSLARKLPDVYANIIQAFIFLIPHLLILFVSPEIWWLLPIIYPAALFAGWIRIKSGSMYGPWLIHAAANVTVAMSVAIRSAG